ncbi:hypothetical protein [Streptosporangium sp. OZ121]
MINPSSSSRPSARFHRTPLAFGCPGVIRLLPGHQIIVHVNEMQFSPELTTPMDTISATVLNLLHPVDETLPTPALRIRFRRSADLADQLAIVEITPHEMTIGIDKTLISEDLAHFLGEAGTQVTRDFIRRTT